MPIPDYISKIEGHGVLKIFLKEKRARLEVSEGERLFEALLRGQNILRPPFITSRICGVCPTAHNLASILALENGLGIKVSDLDQDLRHLMLAGQIIFSHLLHLFFLVLPDYLNLPSIIAVAEKYPTEYHLALNLKQLSDKLLQTVGGRPIHPTTTTVGGFIKYPAPEELKKIKEEIISQLDQIEEFTTLFLKLSVPHFERSAQYLVLEGDSVRSSKNLDFKVSDYKTHLLETIEQFSTAKFAYLTDKSSFLVGALARVSLRADKLNPRAQNQYRQFFPEGFESDNHNPFNNIYSQALEFLNSWEEAVRIIDKLLSQSLPATPEKINLPKIKERRWGVAAVEAPRGILYHAYEIGEEDKIINADIVTPTVQNLTSLEEDAEHLLRSLEGQGKDFSYCTQKLEMLIRAYDPCITCSVH